MTFLIDTNVLLRWSDSASPLHDTCTQALSDLTRQSHILCVCAQVLIESYVVATRPMDVNGLGFSAEQARQMIADIKQSFPCLPEPQDIEKTIPGKKPPLDPAVVLKQMVERERCPHW